MKNEAWIRILLAFPEGEQSDRLRKVLEEGDAFSIRSVTSVNEAISSLAALPFDCVLAFTHLSDGSAVDIIRRYPIVSLIACGLDGDQNLLNEALGSGAVDTVVLSDETLAGFASYLQRLWKIKRRLFLENSFISKRYEDLVQALPDIVYELDTEGRFTFVNQSVRVLGYSPEELVGQHFGVLLFEEDLPHVSRESILPLYEENHTGDRNAPKLFDERRGVDRKTENLELKLRKKTKTRAGDELIATVISYGEIASAGAYRNLGELDDKVFVGTVGIIRDITLRRKSEDMLRKMYQAVDQSPLAVAILDLNLAIDYINPAFFEVTGTHPAEAITRKISDYLDETLEQGAFEDMLNSVKTGIDWKGELRCHRSGSEPFWASILLSAIHSPSGSVTHYLCQIEDISRKHSLDELLKQAKIAAEEASRAKSDFLAGMSHELRTPLSGIIALSELLASDSPRNDQLDRLSSIRSSAANLLYMLNDLLDLSKIEARALELRNGDFELRALVHEALAPFKAQAEQKGLTFQVSVEDGGYPRLNADSVRLSQILANLVSNAVKFSQQGSVETRCSVRARDGRPALFVSVRDTGPGISGADQQKLFKPFSQVGISLSKRYGGTGLGLAISKELAVRMGGDVSLESVPGEGSTFSFFIPVSPADGGAQPESGAQTESITAPVPYNLLVAEDNPVNRDYLQFFLTQAGHKVTLAPDGFQAVAMLEKGDFDAVLMDIQMPGLDGISATNTIRSYTGCNYDPLIPVIALSAFGIDELGEEYHRAGFDAYNLKPVNIQSLVTLIHTTIQGKERFNLERLRLQYAGASDDFRRILMIAVQDLPRRVGSFELARIEGRIADMRESLHSAVSVLSAIGALHALQLIKRFRKQFLELKDEAGSERTARELVDESAAIVRQVEKALLYGEKRLTDNGSPC